nr:hypothetical protein [Tanacetum cinerariifolium]
ILECLQLHTEVIGVVPTYDDGK